MDEIAYQIAARDELQASSKTEWPREKWERMKAMDQWLAVGYLDRAALVADALVGPQPGYRAVPLLAKAKAELEAQLGERVHGRTE